MKPGSRDEPGTRLYTEQQFRDGAIQVLVATEAAGEGINLQVCHILFNYDIPWNPNRLEQRMGRIHRYGQTEGLPDLQLRRHQHDRGPRAPAAAGEAPGDPQRAGRRRGLQRGRRGAAGQPVERVLRDYYAGKLGDADLEERLLHNVDEDRFRAICQNALEGLATKKLNLEMLIERRAQAQERRWCPRPSPASSRDAAGMPT